MRAAQTGVRSPPLRVKKVYRIKSVIASLWAIFIGLNLTLFSSGAFDKEANDHSRGRVSAGPNSISQSEKWKLYDPDPNHLWNRLYRSLYIRVMRDGQEYGYDELDPLLWHTTKYLLNGLAYQQAITLLDEFLSTRPENLIADPMQRAILQHDLWAIFDWTTEVTSDTAEKLNLQIKLAQVMKRLALSLEQIESLPNNYQRAIAAKSFATSYDVGRREQAFLPPDLFDPQGPWVRLSLQGGSPVASSHVQAFSGRSAFLVLMRLPEGREATLKYLKKLSEFPQPWIPDPRDARRLLPNPRLPQFPVGTQLALVRRMVLIDNKGHYTPTNITEQVQIRVHRTIPSDIPDALNTDSNEARTALDVYEFKLSRPKLFAGENGGLRAVEIGETEFPLFHSHGIDLFEEVSDRWPLERHLRVVLNACSNCHFRPGIHSVLSRERGNIIPSWELKYEVSGTKWWKRRQYSWGLLQGLWQSQSSAMR